ncbi:MAG: Fe(3+) ABC transporter substrate-binding protein [Chloroflexaceae bacterium]|nr:Fe(3+) ABC transporter substrate-binding protein [Chloroflexaceae bacterium]
MSKLSRRLFLTGGTAIAAAALTEMGRSRPGAAQSGVVNLYSARHYNTDNALYANFTKQTGIKVNLIEGTADALVERILSEGANSPADVLLTVDAGNLWQAQQRGVFAPINSAALNQRIPASLRDPQGHWYGLTRRARIIIYNKDRVNPTQLSTYEDLANPKWRGKILVRSSSHIYNQSLVAAMIANLGEPKTLTWIEGLMSNLARSPEGNDTAQISACAAGVGTIAIANHYYLARLKASNKPEDQAIAKKVGLFFPDQRGRGTHVNISGGGVLKNAPHRDAAIKFLEYLSTPQVQQGFAEGNYEYPVVAGVALSPILQSFGNFKADPVNVASYGRNQKLAVQLMDRGRWA